MDYPVQLSTQLQSLLKSLRKSRGMTQAELARSLGVVQSRVADIERDPGAVSVEQLLQVLSLLGAQMVVRETDIEPKETKPSMDLDTQVPAKAPATTKQTAGAEPAVQTPGTQPDDPPDDDPRGQW